MYTWNCLLTMGNFLRKLTSNPSITPRHIVGRQVDYVEFCHHLGSCKKRDPLMMSSLTRWGPCKCATIGQMWFDWWSKTGNTGCTKISKANTHGIFSLKLEGYPGTLAVFFEENAGSPMNWADHPSSWSQCRLRPDTPFWSCGTYSATLPRTSNRRTFDVWSSSTNGFCVIFDDLKASFNREGHHPIGGFW